MKKKISPVKRLLLWYKWSSEELSQEHNQNPLGNTYKETHELQICRDFLGKEVSQACNDLEELRVNIEYIVWVSD